MPCWSFSLCRQVAPLYSVIITCSVYSDFSACVNVWFSAQCVCARQCFLLAMVTWHVYPAGIATARDVASDFYSAVLWSCRQHSGSGSDRCTQTDADNYKFLPCKPRRCWSLCWRLLRLAEPINLPLTLLAARACTSITHAHTVALC